MWRRTFQLLHTNGPVLDEVAPLPVIVFLRPAELSVRKSDAKALAQEILSHTRTIVYNVGNKDASEPETSSTMSLVKNKDDGWMRVDLPVELSVSSRLARGASYVRFRLRDEASGRAGAVDLPMKKVLEAPKAGIYGIA